MLRCDSLAAWRRGAVALSTISFALLACAPAAAQAPRNFPATALRGELAVVQPPEVMLNGKPARLAPGARVRDEGNLLGTTGTLSGRRLIVHYTVDISGLISEVWILTPAERARQPWPATREQAATWAFDPVAQVWTQP